MKYFFVLLSSAISWVERNKTHSWVSCWLPSEKCGWVKKYKGRFFDLSDHTLSICCIKFYHKISVSSLLLCEEVWYFKRFCLVINIFDNLHPLENTCINTSVAYGVCYSGEKRFWGQVLVHQRVWHFFYLKLRVHSFGTILVNILIPV